MKKSQSQLAACHQILMLLYKGRIVNHKRFFGLVKHTPNFVFSVGNTVWWDIEWQVTKTHCKTRPCVWTHHSKDAVLMVRQQREYYFSPKLCYNLWLAFFWPHLPTIHTNQRHWKHPHAYPLRTPWVLISGSQSGVCIFRNEMQVQ